MHTHSPLVVGKKKKCASDARPFPIPTFSAVIILKLAPEFVQYYVSMLNGGLPEPVKLCGGFVYQAEALRMVSERKRFPLRLSSLADCKLLVSERFFTKLAVEFVATCTIRSVHVQSELTKVVGTVCMVRRVPGEFLSKLPVRAAFYL